MRGDNVGARSIIFKSNLWLKGTLFLVLWVLSFLILIIVSSNNELNKLYHDAVSHGLEFKLPKNRIGTLSYVCSDPEENHRPVYSISFGGLLVENNNFGLFETAVHKIVKIQDLELAFYKYTPPNITSNTNLSSKKNTAAPDIPTVPEGPFPYAGELLDNISNSINPMNGWRINIDISNTSEVCVTNLDYKVFCDGAALLSVRSRRAVVSSRRPDVVILRGHVIVKAVDGSILESNRVIWDIRKHHFTTDGTYFLTRNGRKIRGKDICVDDKLNIVQAQFAALKEGGKKNG
ncbi:MAG: hypothetical protein PHY02_04800 [Phycisphaerae bacterium]|nr:hypothetical protein [Phycisphaerae bacterium]